MVGPAYAGMIPPPVPIVLSCPGRPRVCGDDPKIKLVISNVRR